MISACLCLKVCCRNCLNFISLIGSRPCIKADVNPTSLALAANTILGSSGVSKHGASGPAVEDEGVQGSMERTAIMADYHVQYDGDRDLWTVKRAGASRVSRTFATKAEATKQAKVFADRSGGGEVNIHNKGGNKIRDKRTIGKKDPRDIKG